MSSPSQWTTPSASTAAESSGNEEPEFSVESPDVDVLPTLCQGCFHSIRHMAQIPRRNAMTNRPRYRDRPHECCVDAVTWLAHSPVRSHTHVQQVAWCLHVDR